VGVTRLSKVSLIVPRSEVPAALRQLSEFGLFHPAQPHSESYDLRLDDLSSKAFRVYIALGEIIRETKLQLEPGLVEILLKGYKVPKEKFTATDWEDLVNKTDAEAKPLIDEISRALGEAADAEKKLQSENAMKEALKLVSGFSIDFRQFTSLNRFHVVFAVAATKDLLEIRNSLPETIILDSALTEVESAIVVASTKAMGVTVEKVLRSFEVEPFSIPPDLPQNPAEAYKAIEARASEIQNKLTYSKQKLTEAVAKNQDRILAIYEVSRSAYEVLNQMKRSGDLKRMAIIQGYIPRNGEEKFKDIFGRWITLTEEVHEQHGHHDQHAQEIPTLMTNPSFTGSFEPITLNQGIPRYGEFDPTIIISIIFPIFYGIMFGDLGHGLVMLLFGLLLLQRGAPGLKKWGMIFTLTGTSASIMGLLIGEVFGFEIKAYIPALGQFTILELVERFHAGEALATPAINIAALKLMLRVSLMLGVIHIIMGNIIGLWNDVRQKEYNEMLMERIPTFTMYIGVILIMFAVVGAKFDVFGAFSDNSRAASILFFINGPPVAIAMNAGTAILLFSIVYYIAAKPLFIKMGRIPKEPLGMVITVGIIEGVIGKAPSMLSNTISYVRLAILLTIHAALLIAVNLLWSQGPAVLPGVVILNLLIILFEGLVVYIQDLRLHLYEWFTKFYSGTGAPFKQLQPYAIRSEIEWK